MGIIINGGKEMDRCTGGQGASYCQLAQEIHKFNKNVSLSLIQGSRNTPIINGLRSEV